MITFENYLIEILKTSEIPDISTKGYLQHKNKPTKKDYDSIHSHIDLRPKVLSDKDIKTIRGYTGMYSNMINKTLDKLHRGEVKHDDLYGDSEGYESKKMIDGLNNIFNNQYNLNRKPVIAYSGIPERIGEIFLKSKSGTKHTLTRFTSSSTDFNKASEFANKNNKYDIDKKRHILKCYIQPNSGVSIAKVSSYPVENEILLRHGAHVTYHHTTTEKHIPTIKNSFDTYIHHITIHPTYTPLEQYGKP